VVWVSLLSKGNSLVAGNVTKWLLALKLQCIDPMVISRLNEYPGRQVFINQTYDLESKQSLKTSRQAWKSAAVSISYYIITTYLDCY